MDQNYVGSKFTILTGSASNNLYKVSSDSLNITFILVNPVVPENVGFACRSIKNMGWKDLWIVGDPIHKMQEARNTAYQAHDILERIRVFSSLASAKKELYLMIGTSAKTRKNRVSVVPSNQLHTLIRERVRSATRIGLVFGSETNGLSQEDERLCEIMSSIPMAQDYPSINLSHSLMIYAYELAKVNFESIEPTERSESVPFPIYASTVRELLQSMDVHARQPELYQRILDKMQLLSPDDMQLFMSLSRYLKHQISRNNP